MASSYTRKQRRAKLREEGKLQRQQKQADLMAMTPDARLRQIENDRFAAEYRKTGVITAAMLEANFKRGYDAARADLEPIIIKAVYSAALMALKNVYKFGTKRLARFLREMDSQVVLRVCDDDLIDEAFRMTGIEILWDEALDRVREAKK